MPPALPTPNALRWHESVVDLYVASPRARAAVLQSEVEHAVSHALSQWRSACPDCSLPEVSVRSLSEWRGAQVDGLNVVALQTGAWCPAKAQGDCYDPGRAAITHQHAALDGRTGALGEADIEINGANFKWSLDAGIPGSLSLRAVLTHELGHFLGLPHSSDPGALMFPHPVDQEAPLPLTPSRADIEVLRALYPPRQAANSVLAVTLAVVIGLGIVVVAVRRLSKPTA